MDPDPSSSALSSDAPLDGADDIEAGITALPPPPPPPPPPLSRAGGERRTRGSRWAGFFFVDDCGDRPRHFLDSCFLCNRPLAGNRDIFMYRGDTPFCSVECRQEEIEMDEASEKKMEMRISRKSSPEKQSAPRNSSPESEKIRVRADTAVVAG